jgi:hypothetical protein
MRTFTQPATTLPTGLMATTLRRRPTVKLVRATDETPQVRYNEHMHLIWINGNCKLDTSCNVLQLLSGMAQKHLRQHDALRVVFDLGKINQSAIKSLMSFFNFLKNQERKGKDIVINWLSPWEEDLYLLAFDLSELYGLKVEIRPY